MRTIYVVILLLLTGCSSTQLVTSWKNPEIVIFDANKVLVVGMTPNESARAKFETRMQREFAEHQVEAVRSIDVFDVEFTNTAQTETQLDEVESLLLERDYDAILFTKVLGSETYQSFRQQMSNLDNYYDDFGDDYLGHQEIYYDADYYDKYTVYFAETSLYCICIGKERQLIWRGTLEISDPIDINKTINEYIELVVTAMGAEDIIFREENLEEDLVY